MEMDLLRGAPPVNRDAELRADLVNALDSVRRMAKEQMLRGITDPAAAFFVLSGYFQKAEPEISEYLLAIGNAYRGRKGDDE